MDLLKKRRTRYQWCLRLNRRGLSTSASLHPIKCTIDIHRRSNGFLARKINLEMLKQSSKDHPVREISTRNQEVFGKHKIDRWYMIFVLFSHVRRIKMRSEETFIFVLLSHVRIRMLKLTQMSEKLMSHTLLYFCVLILYFLKKNFHFQNRISKRFLKLRLYKIEFSFSTKTSSIFCLCVDLVSHMILASNIFMNSVL